MALYTIARFVHIVGALGLFIALGLEWTSLANLRRATTAEQVQEWGKIIPTLRRLGPASLAAILIPGLYMALTAWRGSTWMWAALASMVLLAALGAPNGLRLEGVRRAADAERGALSPTLVRQLRNPFLWISIQTRLGIALGIVFLMTVKPGLGEATLVIVAAVVLGVGSSLTGLARSRAGLGTVA